MSNLILNADSYKSSHFKQYPDNTEYVSSYIEARGGEYDKVVFFGLQAFIKSYLLRKITYDDIRQAKSILLPHGLPFNEDGWHYIVQKHEGRLPISIEAVAEGTVLPTGNVLCQVVNTDPKCYWLSSYIETALLRAVWYPSTVATRSYYIRNKIADFLELTADSQQSLPFMLHDFGSRGCSSLESSGIGGMAHLINFLGTDNLPALVAARDYYGADMAGYSVPAAEHGTIISWGQDKEVQAYANILKKFKGFPVVSVVSDSYDLFNAIDKIWGHALKAQVNDFGGVVVIRPDSGEPVFVVRQALKLLSKHYGTMKNSKGYKVLPPNIRVIQGDGVSEEQIEKILAALKADGFSAENLIFGMGAELLQKINRDTLGFAMKVSAVKINGKWFDVAKQPSTDDFKISRLGRLALVQNKTIRYNDLYDSDNQLKKKYENGELVYQESWSEIVDLVRS